jgi:hypothetical protein
MVNVVPLGGTESSFWTLRVERLGRKPNAKDSTNSNLPRKWFERATLAQVRQRIWRRSDPDSSGPHFVYSQPGLQTIYTGGATLFAQTRPQTFDGARAFRTIVYGLADAGKVATPDLGFSELCGLFVRVCVAFRPAVS